MCGPINPICRSTLFDFQTFLPTIGQTDFQQQFCQIKFLSTASETHFEISKQSNFKASLYLHYSITENWKHSFQLSDKFPIIIYRFKITENSLQISFQSWTFTVKLFPSVLSRQPLELAWTVSSKRRTSPLTDLRLKKNVSKGNFRVHDEMRVQNSFQNLCFWPNSGL